MTAPAAQPSAPLPLRAPIAQPHSRHILLDSQFDALVNRLSTLRPPCTARSGPADIMAMAEHLFEIAAAVDYYIERVGVELAMNAPVAVSRDLFQRQLFKALEGNAIFECYRVADALCGND